MARLMAMLALGLAILAAPSAAASVSWAFRTPGGAAYCGSADSGFLCTTPDDGFWIRLTVDRDGLNARVTKGFDDTYVGYRNPNVPLLRYGKQWASSDASIFSCWSRNQGVTCRHVEGLGFWLGRNRGSRIFIERAGFKPSVRPFFRTGHGVWCGLALDNLEPASPFFLCWRAVDGLSLSLDQRHAAGYYRHEQSRDYRPKGFRLLGDGATFTWRCRDVDAEYATQCSTRAGTPVFTCTSRRDRLTCTNRAGRGFWVSARSFYPF